MSKLKLNAEFVELGSEDVVKLLGIREAKSGETGYSVATADGTKKFVITKNEKNRSFSLNLSKQYSEQMLRGEWVGQWNSSSNTTNGESWIIDRNGNVVSCAHRGFALFLAEHERKRLQICGMSERIDQLGCKRPIKVKALVVSGVDPNGADLTDTGRSRTLGDVLFRRREFQGKEINESVLNRLSRELAAAIRLVWLRINGGRVARGAKLHHPEALAFLEEHPLLHEALLHVWSEDGGNGADGKKISGFVSLGYAAGLLYLEAYAKSDRAKLADGTLDMSRKPKGWSKAEEFWTLFAQDLHSEENPIKSLHTVLGKNRVSEDKYDRDTKCTIVTRAALAASGETDKWRTTRALASGLFSKDGDRQVLNFERFGGFDLERDTLVEMGLADEVEITRTVAGSWKIGDTTWVDQSADGVDPWYGTIEEFSDDGKVAKVFSKDDEASYSAEISTLCIEEPTAAESEEEAEAEEAEA